MMGICGRNCRLDNVACSKAGLWNVLKIRIQRGQAIHTSIFYICNAQGNRSFIKWLKENNVKGWRWVWENPDECV